MTLFAVSFALLAFLASRGALGWAVDALQQYSSGNTTTPQEVRLEGMARNRLQVGGDAAEIRDLLEQTLSIDPNSSAIFMLGELEHREGNDAAALTQFEAYLRIDASYLPAYWRIAEIHASRGNIDAQKQLLRRGLEYFERDVELYVPRHVSSAATNFNDKADAVYNYYLESLTLLREALDDLSDD